MTLLLPTPTRRAFLTSAAAFGASAVLSVSVNRTARAAPGKTPSAIAFDGNALIVGGAGFIRRDDGGVSTPLPGPKSGSILSLATHNDRAGLIVAGLSNGGVALSEDGGQSWEARSQGLPEAPVVAVAAASSNPETLYVSVHGDGLWKSEDAGRSWVFAMDRPWLADAERDLTALASVDLATGMGGIWLYAGTGLGLTRVPDCFCRWQDVQPGDAMDALVSGAAPAPEAPLPTGEPIHALVSVASVPMRLYAALPSGVWASADAGVVWVQRSSFRTDAVAVHPNNADQVVALTEDGLIQTRDGGLSWTPLANN
ncbi:hypothetical protein ACK6D9_22770 (plasmid) [Hoeflea sp. Naph1]|uniref:hypothetical protein n=1 Tax=Hoeflea sp. Naph1 TaxID=3388653 RepID=UPI00398FE779